MKTPAEVIEQVREWERFMASVTVHPDDSDFIPDDASHVRASEYIDYCKTATAINLAALERLEVEEGTMWTYGKPDNVDDRPAALVTIREVKP